MVKVILCMCSGSTNSTTGILSSNHRYNQSTEPFVRMEIFTCSSFVFILDPYSWLSAPWGTGSSARFFLSSPSMFQILWSVISSISVHVDKATQRCLTWMRREMPGEAELRKIWQHIRPQRGNSESLGAGTGHLEGVPALYPRALS